MKKFFRLILAVATVTALALSVRAGMFVFDRSDGEYRDAAHHTLNKSQKVFWLEDGSAANWSFSVNENTVEYKSHKVENLPSGWYEVVLCDLGTTADMFPPDVSGRIAFTLRGDSSFTVKSENAKNAGAIACIVGNNCPTEEAVNQWGNITSGVYQVTAMTVAHKTLPMCMVSSDVAVRLVAQTAGIPIADAVDAVTKVRDGERDLGLSPKKSAWLFLGTEEEYKANTERTDANTVTGDGVTIAPIADAESVDIDAVEQKYPNMKPLADPGDGFTDLEEAAASIGRTPITGYTFLAGTGGNGGEGPENLWDNLTSTKFCTSEFPVISVAALDGEYAIDGIILATANDNASYNDRSPNKWVIYGSNDGDTWTPLAYGDDDFFEETDFTYYASPLTTEGSYKYIQFQASGAYSGVFQVSELVLCGTKVKAAEAPVEEELVEKEPTVEEPVVEETMVEEVAENAVEETEETTEEKTSTFVFGILAVVVVLVSVVGYAIFNRGKLF